MMWPKLKNAPIREAVIDLKFAKPINSELLIRLNSVLKEEYPIQDERYMVGVSASFKGKDHKSKSESHLDGYRLSREDKTFVVLTSISSITLSKLRPYTVWDELKSEGCRLIHKLFEIAPETNVNRIALRYINEFEFLPELGKPIVNYFGLLPLIPKGLPSSLEGYSIKLLLPNQENGLNSILNVTMKTKNESANVSLLFDIDVFKIYNYQNNVEVILHDLEDVRNYKNQIFYSTITDELKDLFN